MAVAKSIHTPSRRREEPGPTPTAPMKAAALNLALVLVGNLQKQPWERELQQAAAEAAAAGKPLPGVKPAATAASPQGGEAAAAAGGDVGTVSSSAAGESSSAAAGVGTQMEVLKAKVAVQSGHNLRLTDELNHVLFDTRRHYCHLLVLNYFSALGGMQASGSNASGRWARTSDTFCTDSAGQMGSCVCGV